MEKDLHVSLAVILPSGRLCKHSTKRGRQDTEQQEMPRKMQVPSFTDTVIIIPVKCNDAKWDSGGLLCFLYTYCPHMLSSMTFSPGLGQN